MASSCTAFFVDFACLDERVLQRSQIRTRPLRPGRDISSLDSWFYNNENVTLAEEMDCFIYPSDLFSLMPKVKSLLRLLLERSSHFRFLEWW